MKPPVLLTDIDGTLGDFLFAALPVLAQTFRWVPSAAEARACPRLADWYAAHTDWTADAFRTQFHALEPRIYPAMPAYPCARSVCRALVARGVHIHYATARDPLWRDLTQAWLDAQGFPPGPLTMGNHDRVALARTIQATVLWDDLPTTLLAARAAGLAAIQIVHPYNADLPELPRKFWAEAFWENPYAPWPEARRA